MTSTLLNRLSKPDTVYFLIVVAVLNMPQVYMQVDQLLSGMVQILDKNGNPTAVGVFLHAFVAWMILDLLRTSSVKN